MWKKIALLTSLMLVSYMGAALASGTTVTLNEFQPGAYALEGQFSIQVSSRTAWNVLSDYDHISDFVSTMQFSQIKNSYEGTLIVEQKASVKFLFFSRNAHLFLKVVEKPFEEILFEDVYHEDFEYYEGRWALQQRDKELLVTYDLKVKTEGGAPGFIKRSVVRNSVVELLDEVRAQMEKRSEE